MNKKFDKIFIALALEIVKLIIFETNTRSLDKKKRIKGLNNSLILSLN
jgi:hypothetical protein